MTILNAILLGIVQGATEFLPVSSSGHLVILQQIMGISEGGLEFAIVLHLGTLLAVFVAYNKSIINMFLEFFRMIGDIFTGEGIRLKKSKYRKYIVLILIASIPAGIIGVLFNDYLEAAFSSLFVVSITLIITGFLLILGDRVGKKNKLNIEKLKYKNAFIIGVFQLVALIPGISRSGSTIVGGLFNGLKKSDAVEFSFLMSIPAVLGSLLIKVKDIMEVGFSTGFMPMLIGFIFAAVIGYLSIRLLVTIVQKGKLMYFSMYCWIVSAALLFYNFIL